MPELTLIYFNQKGRAELSRWILAYGGIPYTDERIEKEDWPEKKKAIYTGKVPVLMVDGEPLPESKAIARYLARLAGLVPEDPFKAAVCDSFVDALSDVAGEGYKIVFSSLSEEEKKKEFKEKLFPNFMKPALERMESKLSGQEWLCGDKISWADLILSLVFGAVHKRKPELMEPYPAVTGVVLKVRDLPAIKQWIETAPDTPY